MVRMMVYVPGKLVRDLSEPNAPIPDKWFYAMGQSLATINKALLVSSALLHYCGLVTNMVHYGLLHPALSGKLGNK